MSEVSFGRATFSQSQNRGRGSLTRTSLRDATICLTLQVLSLTACAVQPASASGLRDQSPLRLLTLEDLEALPEPEWLIDEILPSQGAVLLYGQPGIGKSFLALDWACRVALGLSLGGRPVARGPVIYAAAEGLLGFKRRSAAWHSRFLPGGRGGDVRFLERGIQLLDNSDVDGFLSLLEGLNPGLVVIDTLARSIVGADENSAKDMGIAIQGVRRIQEETGATVLLVHHSEKSGSHERGSSALTGAMDTILQLKAVKSGLLLSCQKQKDAAPFETVALRLLEERPSCIVEYLDEGTGPSSKALSPAERTILRVLRSAGKDGLGEEELRQLGCLKRSTHFRARKQLQKAGLIQKDDDRWVSVENSQSSGSSPNNPTTLKGGTMGPPETKVR